MNKLYSIHTVSSLTLAVLAMALCAISTSAETTPQDQDVPVAPLSTMDFRGWEDVYRLRNDQLTVIIAPHAGRIVHIGRDSKVNLLRLDEGSAGKQRAEDGDWINYGGDWFWPVAQSHWKSFQGNDWPPSYLMDGRPWNGSAWKCADGTLCCLITQDYGEPLNLKVSRLIKLRTNDAAIAIHQSAERTSDSDVPITLWNISQIMAAERVVIPTDADSDIDGGVRPMMFDSPDSNALFRCDSVVVYDTEAGGEAKLCSDSDRGWMAAYKQNTLIVDSVQNAARKDATFPDGGCILEMYSNKGLGYSEIETLSPEVDLDVGETLENVLTIAVYDLPETNGSPCDLAEKVRGLLKDNE